MGQPEQPPADSRPAGTSRRSFLADAALGGATAGFAAPAAAGAPAADAAAVNPRLFAFVGGAAGPWAVDSITAVAGGPLPAAKRLDVVPGAGPAPPAGAAWVLRGVTSNERYATRAEKDELVKKQVALGRPAATRAALIPIRKSAAWWALTQDERRGLFQGTHHTIGLKYLPAVARRLHHCRDLCGAEPFDFVTQFDYAPADAAAFDDLLAALRATAEWKYVEREVDIRLTRDGC